MTQQTLQHEAFRALNARYNVKEVVGQGGGGLVVRAVRKTDEREFAAKIVGKHNLSAKAKLALAREVVVLRELYGADNIVQFEEAFEDSKFVYIVTEYLPGGDLHSRLVNSQTSGLPEQHILSLASQMFRATSALHTRGISSRDIKLENFCFATPPGAAEPVIKMIDLGLCFWRKPGGEIHSKVHCGTLNFASPELVRGGTYVPEESDMWSLGVVLYALITGELPFYHGNDEVLKKLILTANASFHQASWRRVSPQLHTLVRELMNEEPSDRPSSEEALEMAEEMRLSKEAATRERTVRRTAVSMPALFPYRVL